MNEGRKVGQRVGMMNNRYKGKTQRHLSRIRKTSGPGPTEAPDESAWGLCPAGTIEAHEAHARPARTPWDQTPGRPSKPSKQHVEESDGHILGGAGEVQHGICRMLESLP